MNNTLSMPKLADVYTEAEIDALVKNPNIKLFFKLTEEGRHFDFAPYTRTHNMTDNTTAQNATPGHPINKDLPVDFADIIIGNTWNKVFFKFGNASKAAPEAEPQEAPNNG